MSGPFMNRTEQGLTSSLGSLDLQELNCPSGRSAGRWDRVAYICRCSSAPDWIRL